MEILILGGTGAMGKPLVETMLKKSPDSAITVTSRKERVSHSPRLKFITGDARDNNFLLPLLRSKRYDVVVDFMNYDLDEFADRTELLLKATDHYVWMSSSRVYAKSDKPLTESSPRLLEVSNDVDFLATNRYSLRKARQEDLLTDTKLSNYTIIRPYITYNTDRLQLGVLEKEQWLYRLLNGKSIVLSEEMLDRLTTLTYGVDVSDAIADIIIARRPAGEIFQIAGMETIRWRDVLELYTRILREELKLSPTVYASENIKAIEMLWEGGYNTIYDRNYDRQFDSSKIEKFLGRKIEYMPITDGLASCLREFIKSNREFLRIDPVYEAYQDMLCGETSSSEYFDNDTDYRTYIRLMDNGIGKVEGLDNIKHRII